MPGTIQKSYTDDNYNVRTGYDSRDQGHNFSYPHPDSPSAFSQLTTATRRDEEEEEDPNAPVFIRVVAPANLQEGYTIDVLYDDHPYTIEIPRGGVREGQEFEAVIDPKQKYEPHNSDNSSGSRKVELEQLAEEEVEEDSRTEDYHRKEEQSRSSGNDSSYRRHQHKARIYDNGSDLTINDDSNEKEKTNVIKQVRTYTSEEDEENKKNDAPEEIPENAIWYDENGTPIGGWRNRLFGCCDVMTQSTFWMGIFCTPVLMAQLITRLKLTWNGREGPPEETSLSFNRLVLSLVFTMSVFWIPIMGSVCLFVYYLVVIVYVGSHVRSYMRRKYKIPSTLPTRCGDRIDDVCMMLFCGCCSSIQMARHTHDDKDYPGHGCTTTGLEFDAPEIV